MRKPYEKDRVLQRFFWPGVHADIKSHCESCPECQKSAPMPHFRSPLVPLPVIEIPFERIAMDLVGPLIKSARGHQYILVVMDYATRYPEAVPLRNTSSKTIARELFHMFTRTGIPKEILTDQGTPFMSRVMKELCKFLQIKQLRTSVYHPQTDGLVERFNKTLKGMLKKVVDKDGRNWDCLLPYLMFAIREVPQASTGFSPFELLYGRHPRGLLDVAKETWESESTPYKSVVEHVADMQDRLAMVMPLVREHMLQAQEAQSRIYNRSARVRTFQPGDRVLVLVPTVESKFLAKWQGPYEIIERIGEVNYKVSQPDRRKKEQLYHVNLIKSWKDREALSAYSTAVEVEIPHVPEVKVAETLTNSQKQEMREFLVRNRQIFSDQPGLTEIIKHDIITEPGVKVNVRPYRIPEARRQAVAEEIKKMLELDVIEESHSDWSSPIVLVPKPDGSIRFCNDFRKLNEVSKFDAYPMPRVDELIERLGQARYITTLDLTKGYWQVPLTEGAKEKTAFSTPEGQWQYKRLHGAPATFQRMMDRILKPHRGYASAYLDDVVIFSPDWESHLPRVQAVLDSIWKAGLTANPKKCAMGLEEARYLGYVIGRGVVKPQVSKIEGIQQWPRPNSKKQVRAFLGIVGYYRRFVPNFASLASPLTDLTKGSKAGAVTWTPEAEEAFLNLKASLCRYPVLIAPNFKKEFLVQTDASEVGLGAVLSQVVNGEEHPVAYLSRKLTPAECRYAIVERECLAIKWALESLRYYLLGRQFKLITDHAPLKWMQPTSE
uniref:Gypsy retrotransposon integrase-like protein 1 n=1 Tax=Xenopus tropicalis TaxID=8364 RepID=A0A803K005_XENTR